MVNFGIRSKLIALCIVFIIITGVFMLFKLNKKIKSPDTSTKNSCEIDKDTKNKIDELIEKINEP
jgi:uncharacterized membrane protein YvbJ